MEKAKIIANVFGVESRNGIEFIKGNREVVDMEHVSKIKSAMERGEFVPPILIDKATKFVIDGQHRFMAACNIWRELVCNPIFISPVCTLSSGHLLEKG